MRLKIKYQNFHLFQSGEIVSVAEKQQKMIKCVLYCIFLYSKKSLN